MGVRRIFLKNLRDTTFNKDLSNEPNFGRIHLAGQYLKNRTYSFLPLFSVLVDLITGIFVSQPVNGIYFTQLIYFTLDFMYFIMSFCRILSTLCSQVVFHNVPHFSR
jgi:hypothetical protein